MTRREDWPERLNATIKTFWNRPVVWGSFDCCLSVSDCIYAMTDEDPAMELRGYDSLEGAATALRNYCGSEDLTVCLAKMAGEYRWEKVEPKFMQRGDIGVFTPDISPETAARFGGIACICLGPVIAMVSEKGLVALSLETTIKKGYLLAVWHVP